MWIKWIDAKKKNMCGSPKIGDSCMFYQGKGEQKRSNIGNIEKILSHRKFVVRYKISDEFRKFFIKDTNIAIVNINDMHAFFGANNGEENDINDVD